MIIKNFLITGPPASGKTSLLKRIITKLKERQLVIGGIFCPEVRIKGKRWGFKVIDILTSAEGILASVEIKSRYRVSKYGVDINTFERIGVNAILTAIRNADIVVIDEIGKMELFSLAFQEAVRKALDSRKPVIGVIAFRYNHPFIQEVKRRQDTKLYVLFKHTTESMRAKIEEEIYQKIISFWGLYENKRV